MSVQDNGILSRSMIEICAEQLEDKDAVHQVNVAAFGRENEATLVARLRGVASTFSWVAVDLDRVVGHILFSPVAIEGEGECEGLILGLAPVAVLTEEQGKGTGSLLIQQGLVECARLGAKAIVVLGAPKYYRRFGFESAKNYGLRCEYDVPDEAFMVLELVQDALKNCVGMVKYRPEFSMVE
jgi:putative acetyltransferase